CVTFFLTRYSGSPKILLGFVGNSCPISIPALNRKTSAAVQYKTKSQSHCRTEEGVKTMKKLSTAGRFIFWLAIIFTITFLVRAESGDRRASMPLQKQRVAPPIRIFDENGQPAVSGVPSATSTIVDVTVAPGGSFTFNPSTVNISVGDIVRWTWAGDGHSVTSGQPCQADSQYCSPNDMNCASGILSNTGTIYTHTFGR